MNNDKYKRKTMNRTKMNYQQTKIYKIESHLGNKIYIGSTTKQYLSDRMGLHRAQYDLWKRNKNGRCTAFGLFDEYGIENCKIVLIESCPCNSKDEKNAKEAHYIRQLECVNKNIPGRTGRDYYYENKERLNDQHKKWLVNNNEHIKSQRSNSHECECGGQYKIQHKAQHKKTILHVAYEQSLTLASSQIPQTRHLEDPLLDNDTSEALNNTIL